MRRAALAIALMLPAASPAHAQTVARCDRACLSALADRYMDALVAKTPQKLPWADVVRFSENSVPMMIGDGLWASSTAHSARPLIAADPRSGTVAWFGTVEEHGQPAFYAMRMKVEGGRIAEVESVVRRKQGRPPFGAPETFALDSSLAERLPEKARLPRERMVSLVEGYFNGVALNDGTLYTRFDPGCARTENGVTVTSGGQGASAFAQGCEAQFKLGLFRAVDRVRARRLAIVDEERGIVVALGTADYGARTQAFTTTDGRPFAAPTTYPHSQGFVTIFKLGEAGIRRVDEFASELPYLMPPSFKE